MADRSERRITNIGLLAVVGVALLMAASFNLQKLPWLQGTPYQAELKDAAGLRKGSQVQVSGIRVGRVNDVQIGREKVVVTFDVDDARLGSRSTASVEVLNLLGEKFLNITPAGGGELPADATIPLDRTEVSFDIVGTLNQLTDQTERTDKETLKTALTTLGDTLDAAAPEVKGSFTGLSRLSTTIASRDADIDKLLTRSQRVVDELDARKGDLVSLMGEAKLVFDELQKRKDAIRALLVDATTLADELDRLVKDNREQLRPTLDQLDSVLSFLNEREDQLEDMLRNYGPYVNILGNVVGTGPWYDIYVPNITGPFTGEFTPVKPKVGS